MPGRDFHDLLHPEYPFDWAVMVPNIHFGDLVIYSGSYKEARGAFGVITAITHVKKTDALLGERFEWRYTITIDDGKNSKLTNVREESFTKAETVETA